MARHFGKFNDFLDVEYRANGRVFLLIGQRAIPLPRHKAVRITLGACMAVIGLLPFLPISFIGLLILSVDVPWLGKLRHQIVRAIGGLVQRVRGRPSAKVQPQVVLALPNEGPHK